MVTGKTKEKRLSCGAERVIIPAATFIINIVPATGIIINAAAINILPAALIPAPIRIAPSRVVLSLILAFTHFFLLNAKSFVAQKEKYMKQILSNQLAFHKVFLLLRVE